MLAIASYDADGEPVEYYACLTEMFDYGMIGMLRERLDAHCGRRMLLGSAIGTVPPKDGKSRENPRSTFVRERR